MRRWRDALIAVLLGFVLGVGAWRVEQTLDRLDRAAAELERAAREARLTFIGDRGQ